MSTYAPKDRANFTATITNGTAVSAAVDIGQNRLRGLQMPAAWTAAGITFQVSADGVTFADLYDKGGTEYALTVVASHFVILPPADFKGVRFLKVRSGTGSVPVNQGADRAITLVTDPSEWA